MSSSRCSCLLNKNCVYLFYFKLQKHMGNAGCDPSCYTKARVSCQKSNKTFLHGVVGETSKHWKHRWISSPVWTEWLCYVPEPCFCSCSSCAEGRCAASAQNYLYFALVPHQFCVGELLWLDSQLRLLCKMGLYQKKSILSSRYEKKKIKYILTCKINSRILWAPLGWEALAAKSMSNTGAVALPVVSACSQGQGFVSSHLSRVRTVRGHWSWNAWELKALNQNFST